MITPNRSTQLFHLFKRASLALSVILLGDWASLAAAYDVEADSTGNKVYILLINDNPATSYDSITINNAPPGIVTSASASIIPGSVAAGGSDLAALDFDIAAAAALGASGDLMITVGGSVVGQSVDVMLTVPLTVVASAATAQGEVGPTLPAPDPGGIDSDGDGVSDALELAFDANPYNPESLPGQIETTNIPVFGAVGATALALLLLLGGASANRSRNASLLAIMAVTVTLLPTDLSAGTATRIQLVAHIPIPPPMPQQLSATASASSVEVGGPPGVGAASLAVDNNISTRWGSVFSDYQWLTLDLGSTHALTEVIIHWEAANAAVYEIQGSNDNSNWSTLSSQSGGTFGDRTDTVAISGSYQYVRMLGQARSSVYGYSIYEMQVYGLPAADADGDGVDDSIDQCPATTPGATVDATGCEIADSDNDGVYDAQDQCPGTPPGAVVDAAGCEVISAVNEVASINDILAGGAGSSQPGLTLYVFDNDPVGQGVSNCNGDCASNWPPLLVNDGVASGVSDLGTIVRSDNSVQATYNGRPLYYFAGDSAEGDTNGDGLGGVWHTVAYVQTYVPLFDMTTALEPVASYVRNDGVVVTRFADRGRDRHAKDIGYYGGTNYDHYDHYLAHYWEFRTARIMLEDFVPTGQSLIRATYVTENQLGAKEFRVWFHGQTTTGQFHFNPTAVEIDSGTFDDNLVKISSTGNQYKYTVDITEQWKNVATFNEPLQTGVNMEFEISQFLINPPAGSRVNYYGTSYVYVIGTPGLAPFEWQRGVYNDLGVNDGTPIPAPGLLGGDTTLGYNYSEEPAGRFMQMATNLSPGNAQPFVRGRRVHHTNFINGVHDERNDNPVWTSQIGKAGNHYINTSCANCHVRNGRGLVADVGSDLDKWVFKVGDANGNADPALGKVLQPNQTGSGTSEGDVTLGAWTNLANGLRAPNYVFSNGTPARFSARIAPQLVGMGLLEAIPEADILAWEDPSDANNDGISGRAALVTEPVTGLPRLGRFGYKAATASVEHQVASALNTDIGVMTSILPTPDCGSSQSNCGASGQELSDAQLNDLVKYISLLGVGARRDYANTAGENLFASIGCGSCHRNTYTTSDYHPLAELRGQTIHPYTDMLLHDMGAGLADNHGEGNANGAEWRTAPLWGLGLARNVMLGDAKANDTVTQPIDPNDVNRIGYLHDGRARTIEEAILWHGGEAEAAKLAYEALSASDKAAVLAFLESL